MSARAIKFEVAALPTDVGGLIVTIHTTSSLPPNKTDIEQVRQDVRDQLSSTPLRHIPIIVTHSAMKVETTT